MKYQPLPISKTYHRFVALAGKVQRLLDSGEFQQLSAQQKNRLAGKLKQLYLRLSQVFSQSRLRRILASGALIIGLGGSALHAQQFAPPVEDPFGLNSSPDGYISFFSFADLDNDGDQDLLAIQYNYDAEQTEFAYFENTGTPESPAFAPAQINPFGLSPVAYITTPFLVDIDNDGDQDLFVGSLDDDIETGIVLYFENQGSAESPSFAAGVNNPFGLQSTEYLTVPAFADLDNDGDLDFLGTAYNALTELYDFRYQENTGDAGAPQFAAPLSNPFGLSTQGLYVVIHAIGDLDMDGDFDIIAGGTPFNYEDPSFVQYLENTGTAQAPAFAAPVTNPFGITFPPMNYYSIPSLVDIDNDGDLDLFVTTYFYDENTGQEDIPILYFENTSVVNSRELSAPAASLRVFPTVTDGRLNWQLAMDKAAPKLILEAFAGNGQRVKQWRLNGLPGEQQGQIDVGALAGGLYQLRLSDGSGRLLAQERFVVR
ncbi:MAG: VCBS repeat-containing protein [Phaeodactylibacter sp.]|nr:VCBS repeat-containing protein [Phaeodactylibacter sp.]MCB9263936.1 VCBS repeat-containing protein [Lewinellaceae bacterium]MCB9289962.1 VCBS repeat-containing protein [Lewinellaceae bacterium]